MTINNSLTAKPRLLVISHVCPFPGESGQQKRVANKLKAFRESFHTTFLTALPAADHTRARVELLEHCDEVILLPAHYPGNFLTKSWHRAVGIGYSLTTGLKFSNYQISRIEFTAKRVMAALGERRFDLALFEYWHAAALVPVLQERDIPCVLDMHNILWRSYQRQLQAKRWLPGWLKKRLVRQYQQREQSAWGQFDALIAINQAEMDYARLVVGNSKQIFYTPMGVDLDRWSYSWQPAEPPRIAYYGGLGSAHNQHDAMTCYREIMPLVWNEFPQAELWLVGSNPPDFIRALSSDRRVTITGYVEQVQDVLSSISLLLCPWSGTYGFRSRLVEVMALGVPVIASLEAVHGMDLQSGNGILLSSTTNEMAEFAIRLLGNTAMLIEQSLKGREKIIQLYNFTSTYRKLDIDLANSVKNPSEKPIHS